MKVIALLEVDEKLLAETGQDFEKEMMTWAAQSRIRLVDSRAVKDDYEYAAFIWNKNLEAYEQVGRPVMSEMLAINRCQAYLKNGWFCQKYDTNRVVFKRRIVSEFYGRWEAIESEEQIIRPE